ncbi:MAG TPA: hypothetical protein VIN66_08405 [Rheinheimera sp.]|uniref:tetratricopeptide repeat protein n=1 Tax=Rheinheimera sp. TaxID=1869214 RepID=UPI002F934D33
MSVLNKMLRDLEQRQHASDATTAITLHGRSDERPLWLNVLLLLSALLLAFAVYAILTREPAPESSEAVPAVANPALTDHVTSAALPDSAAEPVISAEVIPATMQQSTPVASTASGGADTGVKEQAAIDTVNETNTEATADNALQSTERDQAGSESDVTAQTQTIATELARPTLPVASVVANTAANAEAKTEVTVVRVPASPQQQAALLQQQALAAAQAGQLQQALQLWQQLQQFAPQNAVAYLEQARLWHQLGQPQQALTVLQQALQQGIVHADIQLLLAQQAAAQAQWQRVDTLLPAQFVLAQQPEYYGLKATALQQLGQPQAALDWFSQLIVLQPQQARWWLGAAIAFDALSQPEQAQLHYRQALQWGDSLTAASRNYIQQRLAAIE